MALRDAPAGNSHTANRRPTCNLDTWGHPQIIFAAYVRATRPFGLEVMAIGNCYFNIFREDGIITSVTFGGCFGGGGGGGQDPFSPGIPGGAPGDISIIMGPPKQPPLPLECRPEFIAAARAAWQRAGNGMFNTEAGFFVRGGFSNPAYVPAPYTNELRKISFRPQPNDLAMMHTHPHSGSDFPSPPSERGPVDQTGYFRPGDHQWVPVYTGSKAGLYVSDPTSKTGYTQLRQGLDWLKPCL